MTGSGRIRVGDAERDDMAGRLREHHAAGRLDAAELVERLDQTFAARTRDDLAAVTADLPEPVDPVGDTDVRGFGTGSNGWAPARRAGGAADRRHPRPAVLLAAAVAALWVAGGIAWSVAGGTHPGPGAAGGHGPGPWPLVLLIIAIVVLHRRRRTARARHAVGRGPADSGIRSGAAPR